MNRTVAPCHCAKAQPGRDQQYVFNSVSYKKNLRFKILEVITHVDVKAQVPVHVICWDWLACFINVAGTQA